MPMIIQVTAPSGFKLMDVDKRIDNQFPFRSTDKYLGIINAQGPYGQCVIMLGEGTPNTKQIQWLEMAKHNKLITDYVVRQVTYNDIAQLMLRKGNLA